MQSKRFILKSLRFFRKQHLAILLATFVSAAVLTGALIVGDSVKMSLKQNVENRLGETQFALSCGDRFVRTELGYEIGKSLQTNTSSVLFLNGICINPEADKRINRTQILGVDDHFWKLSGNPGFHIQAGEAVVSEEVASELDLGIGSNLLLRIQNTEVIPLNAPFTSDEDPSLALRLKVIGLASKEQLCGFSLKNQQETAFNVFVNRDFLADKMELSGLSNLVLIAGNEDLQIENVHENFRSHFQLKDAALHLKDLEELNEIELTSDRIFIEHQISGKLEKLSLKSKKVLTYFVNSLETDQASTPYSFVTAASDDFIESKLTENEIIINSWLADDLGVKVGDSLSMKYFIIGPLRSLSEDSSTFIVKEILPLGHAPFLADLMPDFPGLSTAGNCSEWDAGIPIDLKKIRDKDEQYWDDYKGTPKAIISLKMGQKLWGNLYGDLTAIRYDSKDLSKIELEEKLLQNIAPEDVGLYFRDVKSIGQQAANNGIDFGQLFLSLSFFVIAASILLLVLIHKLNMESRQAETGLLLAQGFRPRHILKWRLLESLPPLVLGSILGGIAGIAYNYLMILGLNGIWNQAVHTDILQIFILPKTLIIGILISIFISSLSIFLVLRNMLKKSAISIIKEENNRTRISKNKTDLWISIIGVFGAIGLIVYSVQQSIEQNSSLMLSAGFLMLVGLVACLSMILRLLNSKKSVHQFSISRLAFLNARRNKSRSLAVVALLAIGTFTIIVTGANRKTFYGQDEKRSSGTGGFKYWAETSVPILQNLNTIEGKESVGLEDNSVSQQAFFFQMLSRTGDDASCLNLNQVQQAQILGINPSILNSLGAFSFANSLETNEHPWLVLEKFENPNIIPAIADQTVIQWGLIKKLGDTLSYINEAGQSLKLVLVAGLNASIFQGNILISEESFRYHFPSAAGSKYMLIDSEESQQEVLKNMLNNSLTDYGIQITPTIDRLTAFYSVTNTYLSIFMILGGLGVLIGTIGLAIILLRNMLERKSEFELLKALGFQSQKIFKIVFLENLFLIVLGIGIGLLSSLLGILPSILSPAFHIPSSFLVALVLAVFLSAVFWIFVVSWRLLTRPARD